MQKQQIKLVAILTVALACSSAHAQFARTVSRANCLVPTLPLLSPQSGITFNESISWSPIFWKGHFVTVSSKHMWTRWVGGSSTGYWDDRLEASYQAGSLRLKTWRAWAGKINLYNNRTVAGDKRGYRWITATHTEKLPNLGKNYLFYTNAVNCNITKW